MTRLIENETLLPRIVTPGNGPSRVLVPGQLAVGLAVDDRGDVRDVTHADLDGWGRSIDDLYPTAVRNLRSRSDPGAWEPIQTVPGMQLYRPHGGDAAARMLLLPELIKPWPLAGVVFAVPSKDQLLCVPIHHLKDVEAVRVLVTATAFAVDTLEDALTDQLFWFDGQTLDWLRVQDDGDGVEVLPTPRFLRALERLTALELVTSAAEA